MNLERRLCITGNRQSLRILVTDPSRLFRIKGDKVLPCNLRVIRVMSTTLPMLTAVQLEEMPDDGFRYDLLRGELLQMSPAGREHGKLAGRFFRLLSNFIDEHDLGETYASETGFLLETDPDTVLAPDVSYVSRERVPAIANVKGYIPLAPDLAVEVISPSDRYTKVDEKLETWLDAGTRVVIVLNPRKSVARVYRPQTEMQTYTVDQSLELPDILPGWSVKLSTLFD